MFFLPFIMFLGSCNAQNLLRGLTTNSSLLSNLTTSNITAGQTNPTAEIAIYSILGVVLSVVALCCLCACCKALDRAS